MGKIEDNKDLIITWYTQNFLSGGKIAELLKVSRQGINLALREWGFDTSKAGSYVEVICSGPGCGRVYKVPRSRARVIREKGGPNFCGKDCYNRWVKKQRTGA